MLVTGAPRIHANFLPKFDNQAESARLTRDPATAGARCLAVTKKHSGHLVMCPPFYSKNGCANRYSRAGELLLRAHFNAVFPGRGGERFDAWWAHAEAHGLCYSFECIVPRVLGDHGATPRAAYMVLTVVSHVGSGGTFLSPAQLLVLATAWRLPVNEVTYVPWTAAAAVEEALHSSRWTATDADATAYLASAGALQQGFLPHGETQGNVLEGFVLMALDVSIADLQPLIARYEAAVAKARPAALREALRLGAACHAREAWLTEQLDAGSGAPEARRIEGMNGAACWDVGGGSSGGVSGGGGSGGGCSGGGSGGDGCSDQSEPLRRLFRTLRASYAHRVALKAYEYKGSLQLQIDVSDDQIFFGWGIHQAVSGCAPLYRGMVVQFDGRELPPVSEALRSAVALATATSAMDVDAEAAGGFAATAVEAKRQCVREGAETAGAATGGRGDAAASLLAANIPGARVLGIAKLKCLNYLVRTFGVRNLLPILLEKGAPAYLAATERFYKNWSVPTEHCERLAAMFSGWAREVMTLPEAERRTLRGGEYLWLLEPYLAGERRGTESAPFGAENFLVLLVNLRGAPLPREAVGLYAPGLIPVSMGGGNGGIGHLVRAGHVMVLEAPPSGRLVGAGSGVPSLVVLFPPPETAEIKWHKMWGACTSLETRFPQLRGRVFVEPPIDEWRSVVASLAAALPPPPPSYAAHTVVQQASVAGASVAAAAAIAAAAAAAAPAAAAAAAAPPTQQFEPEGLPVRTVVVILGLPPGGGKSSLFGLLRAEGAAVVSSDEEQRRGGNFDQVLVGLLRQHPLVCYDKNVPNLKGLEKVFKVLGNAERSQRVAIRLLPIVPASVRHDVAWRRVCSRPSDDPALNIHTCKGGEREAYRVFRTIFFDECERFLPMAHALPGAIVTDAFWEGMHEARQVARQALMTLPQAAPLAAIRTAADAAAAGSGLPATGTSAASDAAAWLCAEIPRSNLHLTLVPPPIAPLGRLAGGGSGRGGGGGGGGFGDGGGGGGGGGPNEHSGARAEAVRRLRRFAGQRVRIGLGQYHLFTARHPADAEGGGEGEGGEDNEDDEGGEPAAASAPPSSSRTGRAGRGGLVMPERQCGVWEVEGVYGLPEDAHYPPQRAIYHVTDTAALIGCAPREAGELLRALRSGELGTEWQVSSTQGSGSTRCPAEVDAMVRIVA